MFESIKGIIGDIASGAIKDQRIALSQEQLAALDAKLVSLAGELTASKARESNLATDNENLRTRIQNLQPIAGGFHEFCGTLWKRSGAGFEPFPYCKECSHHPVMIGQPPHPLMRNPMFWQCSNGHTAPFAGRPVA
jgi:hypothetical protein